MIHTLQKKRKKEKKKEDGAYILLHKIHSPSFY